MQGAKSYATAGKTLRRAQNFIDRDRQTGGRGRNNKGMSSKNKSAADDDEEDEEDELNADLMDEESDSDEDEDGDEATNSARSGSGMGTSSTQTQGSSWSSSSSTLRPPGIESTSTSASSPSSSLAEALKKAAGGAEDNELEAIVFTAEEDRQRFLLELEFVQQLANPRYLHSLATGRYFQDKAFINYLSYLQYWKRREYAKYLVYPQCLHFLDLLQHEQFRNELLQPSWIEYLHKQQYYHWRHYKENRYREALQAVAPNLVPPQQDQSGIAPAVAPMNGVERGDAQLPAAVADIAPPAVSTSGT